MTPARYDFDEVFHPLPVLNQHTDPTCVRQTRANMTNAFLRIWGHRTPHYAAGDVSWAADDDDPACGFVVTTPTGTHKIRNGTCEPGWVRPTTPDQTRTLLRANGVLEISVASRASSFAEAWGPRLAGRRLKRRRLPVIVPRADDGPVGRDHDVLVVGDTPAGLIVLNSWGRAWGKDGRAILSWAYLARYGCFVIPYTFDGHPLGTAYISGVTPV